MRTSLWIGLTISAAALTGPAQAQVQSGPGFFGYVDGMYLLDDGPAPQTSSVGAFNRKLNPGDGYGSDGKLGWSVGDWDIAISGAYHDYSAGRNRVFNANLGFMRQTDAKAWFLGAELGRTFRGPGWGVRSALGLRYQEIAQRFSGNILLRGAVSDKARSYGLGPHVGVDAAIRLTETLSLFGGLDMAFLFGKVKNNGSNVTFFGPRASDSRMIWQIGAKVGVDWEIASDIHIAAGYAFNALDGAAWKGLAQTPASLGAYGRGRVLEHGPFIRLAYNWGAPPSGAPAMAPLPAGTKSFIVFFDFDRANLTPTAVQTIKQAAAQTKTGKTTRIDVTGHADRSGSDAYNMALSLRRANAVRDQLVREGVPANQIVVVGRGESQPLVPTADGVREPQNRRVEIVLQ